VDPVTNKTEVIVVNIKIPKLGEGEEARTVTAKKAPANETQNITIVNAQGNADTRVTSSLLTLEFFPPLTSDTQANFRVALEKKTLARRRRRLLQAGCGDPGTDAMATTVTVNSTLQLYLIPQRECCAGEEGLDCAFNCTKIKEDNVPTKDLPWARCGMQFATAYFKAPEEPVRQDATFYFILAGAITGTLVLIGLSIWLGCKFGRTPRTRSQIVFNYPPRKKNRLYAYHRKAAGTLTL